MKDSGTLKLSLIEKGVKGREINIQTWAASLMGPLLPLSLYSPWSMDGATQGAQLGSQVFQGCPISGRLPVTRSTLQAVTEFQKSNTNRVGGTGNLSLKRPREQDRSDTWKLLFHLGVQVPKDPAQSLAIQREAHSHVRDTIISPSPGHRKADFTVSPGILREVLFPILLDFGFPSSETQFVFSSSPVPGCRPPRNMSRFHVPL